MVGVRGGRPRRPDRGVALHEAGQARALGADIARERLSRPPHAAVGGDPGGEGHDAGLDEGGLSQVAAPQGQRRELPHVDVGGNLAGAGRDGSAPGHHRLGVLAHLRDERGAHVQHLALGDLERTLALVGESGEADPQVVPPCGQALEAEPPVAVGGLGPAGAGVERDELHGGARQGPTLAVDDLSGQDGAARSEARGGAGGGGGDRGDQRRRQEGGERAIESRHQGRIIARRPPSSQ